MQLNRVTDRGLPATLHAALLAVWLSLGPLAACVAPSARETALVNSLNGELLRQDSATAALEHWCAGHHLATDPRVRAERLPDADHPADAAVRRELHVGPDEPVRYRHVRLRCGAVRLSEADNWYVPARLTPAMNASLDSSDEPFGRVVQPLGFRRVRLTSSLSPVPPPSSLLSPSLSPGQSHPVLVHRAILVLPDGTPFSYVVESYQREALPGH